MENPAQFWVEINKCGDGFTLVCFRSVAMYVMGLMSHWAMKGRNWGECPRVGRFIIVIYQLLEVYMLIEWKGLPREV